MSEVKRYTGDLMYGEPIESRDGVFVYADDFDRVTAERDAALGRELQSRNDLAKSLADHFRKNSEISALGEASKKLVFCARTSGGTAGPDQGLMDACAGVEGVITLGGIARAMNEFERLTAECDDLASRLEEALVESLANQNEREVVCVNYEALQQRLTAADERVGVLEGLVGEVLDAVGREPLDLDAVLRLRARMRAALKPAEVGADSCEFCKGWGFRSNPDGADEGCGACNGTGKEPSDDQQ